MMSYFTVLIFDDEVQKEEAWRIANSKDIILSDWCYSVDPVIESHYLFMDEPIISTARSYYSNGCRTLYDIFMYEQEKVGNKKSKGEKYRSKKVKDMEMHALYIENIKSRYLKLIDFIDQVIKKCGSLSVLSHDSDHSCDEYVSIKRIREVKLSDLTVEMFIFLSTNTLLKIT